METIATTPATQSLKTMTVKEFMSIKGFASVHNAVRENVNRYPYVTFISASNVAENIYFSKSSSAEYAEGVVIARGFFDKLIIAECRNAQGELRYKLAKEGGTRLSMDDLF